MSPLLIAALIGFAASLIAAYNMGWHAGHDIHHDDSAHGHRSKNNPKPPRRPNLYV